MSSILVFCWLCIKERLGNHLTNVKLTLKEIRVVEVLHRQTICKFILTECAFKYTGRFLPSNIKSIGLDYLL